MKDKTGPFSGPAYDLLPADVRATIPRIGGQESLDRNAVIFVKWFFPMGAYTVLITEADHEEDDDTLCFGYATLDGDAWEWGYISLAEVESTLVHGLKIERDLHLSPGLTVEDYLRGER